ncbi:FimV/HubP family polar landmark protein [Methylotenera sp.]|uniref:FimV/HubP family polar landmark protein n=1 Tax=Methylotenera sp. TaxID=2051956 RepID=UPI00273397AA|nr:FimV/HubP family polar landmark protein [Methylotenera sp.]MDP3776446.1 FimV/HubP family polar landmark protein [Methylotenera sp.]
MRKSKIKQISLAVCMAFMPIVGYTAGLGKLNVNSGLGEPLKVDVELLSVTPEELSTLTAAIASEEAYNVQGITRLGVHNNIKVDLAKSDTGAPILRIRSSTPINDPYLDMLIQVDWASGRLLREYTVLLDPPEYKQAANAASDFVPIIKPSATSGVLADSNTQKTLTPNTSKTSKKKISTAKPEDLAQKEVDVDELTTKRGDTLAAIAQKMQVDGVSLDQMLVGLFENNKSAFANNNMNQLKVGQIIKAPSTEALTAIDPKQAKQALKVHASNWNAYRNALAGNVKTALASEESEPKQSASGKIASAEDKSAAVKPGVQDVVKLSAGEKNAVTSQKSGTAEADAKIIALQEEATARENALKESLSRAAALEKQIEDMQKLLALKNQTMTELQKNAEVTSEPVAEKPAVEKPAETKPEVKAQPKKQAAKVPPPEPVQEPSFIESLLSGLDIKLLGGTSALVVLAAGWLFLRNKRRKELDSFERGILTSGGLRANTVFGNTTGNSSTSDTSFLTDFAQSADGSMIDTNDVDPIAEAEVYMAYGRDAQAEEILKDAIVKEPKRYELHLKLLEMYAGRKDVSAFEAVAGELYTTLGADDPTWARVAEMGQKLEPENPLYDISSLPASAPSAMAVQAGAVASAVLSHQDDVSLDFSLDDEPNTSSEPKNEFQITEEVKPALFAGETTAEVSPSSVVMESFSSAPAVDEGLEFDLGVPDVPSASEIDDKQAEEVVLADSAATDESTATVDDNTLEFTFASDADADAELVEATPVNPETEAIVSDADSFEVPSFLDTAPNIEFSSESESSTPIAFNEEFSIADNSAIDFSTSDSEPVAFEIPDTPMEISFDVPSDKIEGTSFDGSLPLIDHPEIDNANLQSSNESVNFDFSLDETDTAPIDTKDSVSDVASNEFDFSAISLDLGDDDTQSLLEDADDSALDSPIASEAVSSENQDVDIKLDLVAAYIDMDDKEGARELLEEVLKEGGPQQKLKAEQLLAGL